MTESALNEKPTQVELIEIAQALGDRLIDLLPDDVHEEIHEDVSKLRDAIVDRTKLSEELAERDMHAAAESEAGQTPYDYEQRSAKLTAERDAANRGWDESTEAWALVQAHPAVESADGKLVDHVLAALDNGVVARAIADDAIVQGNREKTRGDGLAAVIAATSTVLTKHGVRGGRAAAISEAKRLLVNPAATLAARDAEKKAEGARNELRKAADEFGSSYWPDHIRRGDVQARLRGIARGLEPRTPQQGEQA